MRRTQLRRTTATVVAVTLGVLLAVSWYRTRYGAARLAEAGRGERLFVEQGCANCHYRDRRDKGIGPGLAELFQRKELPASRRPVTRENVRRQMVEPFGTMPSYAQKLSEEQLLALLDYLETL